MAFPKQELLVLRPQSSQHVVSVHYDMYKRVDHTNEGPVTPWVVLRRTPRNHGHHCMMVQVEEGNLSLFLPENEEYRIK